jgi:hypothetical protein
VLAEWCVPRATSDPVRAAAPLAEFLTAGGAAALYNQNRFQAPVDEDGWSVFYVENQHVCTWAYRTDDPDPDPQVHVREDQADAYVPVGCRLDAFLSAAAVVEAVFGAPVWRAGSCPPSRVDELLGLPRLPLPGLGWPEVSYAYHRGPGVIAHTHLGDHEAWVFVGAREPEALRDMDERLRTSPDWEFASWGPGDDPP